MYLSITKDDTNEDTGNKHVDPLQVDVDEDHIDIEGKQVNVILILISRNQLSVVVNNFSFDSHIILSHFIL